MTEFINALFTNPLISRGALVGILVALCASLLGVPLVLKRYSMIGDGLSHVAFGSLGLAFALGLAPLYVTIPVVMLAAFFLLRISESSSIKGDSAIALIASTSLAVGVVSASVGGVNIDVNSYMFGSILLVGIEEVWLCILLAVFVIGTFVLCYHDIFLVTHDEDFARASGMSAGKYKTVLSLLTALTVVVGMRIMGTLLISSLVIFPALTAMRAFKSFRGVMICSATVSVAAFVSGLFFSYFYDIPTGASIVLSNAVIFAAFFIFGKITGKNR